MDRDTVYIIAAVVLGLALLLFSFERFLYRWILMARIRFRWFPYGRFVLFVCPDTHPHRMLIESEILPGLGDKAYFHKTSAARVRPKDPDERLAATLARWFMEPERDGPVAIVFKPDYEFERIDFSEALAAYADGSEKMLASRRDRLYRIADSIADRIRVYI